MESTAKPRVCHRCGQEISDLGAVCYDHAGGPICESCAYPKSAEAARLRRLVALGRAARSFLRPGDTAERSNAEHLANALAACEKHGDLE